MTHPMEKLTSKVAALLGLTQWLTSYEWGFPANYGPTLAMGQPNSSYKPQTWDTPQNFFLTFIDEFPKQIVTKKLLKFTIKNKMILIFTMLNLS